MDSFLLYTERGGSMGVSKVKDSTGKTITAHDILKNEKTGEKAIVITEYGLLDKTSLAVQNKVTGLANWLNVYPDGVWTIVGTTKNKEEGEKNE